MLWKKNKKNTCPFFVLAQQKIDLAVVPCFFCLEVRVVIIIIILEMLEY